MLRFSYSAVVIAMRTVGKWVLGEKLTVLDVPRALPALNGEITPEDGKDPGGDSDHHQILQ